MLLKTSLVAVQKQAAQQSHTAWLVVKRMVVGKTEIEVAPAKPERTAGRKHKRVNVQSRSRRSEANKATTRADSRLSGGVLWGAS